MKMKLDTKKIYLAMAGNGLTATEIVEQGGVANRRYLACIRRNGYQRAS